MSTGLRPRGFELVTDGGLSVVAQDCGGRTGVHRMPAWKVVVTLDGQSEVTSDSGRARGRATLVPPGMANASRTTGPFLAVFIDAWLTAGPSGRAADLGARRAADLTEAGLLALNGGGTAALRAVTAEVIDTTAPPTVAALVATITPTSTVEDLAANGGISVQHLRRRLRSELGTSFTELSRWARLKAAFASLSTTSIAEAAATAGFADQAHFTRITRTMVGRTPGSLARIRGPASCLYGLP